MRLLFNYESRIRLLTGGRVVSNGLFCLTVCSYSVTILVMNLDFNTSTRQNDP